MKRQAKYWEKIFANHISDQGFVSRTYRGLKKLDNQKTYNPIKKGTKDLNRHFTKEVMWMADEHMKRCSACH